MAFSGYLKIPDIDGESKASDHEDEIDVWGVSWALEQSARSTRARRARRRTDIDPFQFHKFYDASSPYLVSAASRGKSFDEIVFTVRKDSGEAHLDYLVITMENVTITSYQMFNTERDDADARIMERFELDAENIGIVYKQQSPNGTVTEHEVQIDAYET